MTRMFTRVLGDTRLSLAAITACALMAGALACASTPATEPAQPSQPASAPPPAANLQSAPPIGLPSQTAQAAPAAPSTQAAPAAPSTQAAPAAPSTQAAPPSPTLWVDKIKNSLNFYKNQYTTITYPGSNWKTSDWEPYEKKLAVIQDAVKAGDKPQAKAETDNFLKMLLNREHGIHTTAANGLYGDTLIYMYPYFKEEKKS